jgi:glycosyltransferase involved in cell wall biosynthesis
VAAGVAERLGIPYGFSIHARDARKVSRPELRARAAAAACVVACNSDVAREVDGAARLHLVPHGVDLTRFAPARNPNQNQNPNLEHGTRNLRTTRLLAVGRLVEKKGFHVLLEALASLEPRFELRIVGDGPERERLNALVAGLGLAGRVRLSGPSTHHELPGEYARADIVVVPSIVDAGGDRDGLPNVVLEALASGRPIVASAVGAVASAVRDGHTGLLVPPGDVKALRAALRTVADNRARAAALARAGRALVEREYDIRRCTAALASVLMEAYA